MKKEFIKNILNVEVDGLRGINHYTILAMFDLINEDGYADIIFETVDKFSMTWKEIDEDGGISAVNKDLEECYGVVV